MARAECSRARSPKLPANEARAALKRMESARVQAEAEFQRVKDELARVVDEHNQLDADHTCLLLMHDEQLEENLKLQEGARKRAQVIEKIEIRHLTRQVSLWEELLGVRKSSLFFMKRYEKMRDRYDASVSRNYFLTRKTWVFHCFSCYWRVGYHVARGCGHLFCASCRQQINATRRCKSCSKKVLGWTFLKRAEYARLRARATGVGIEFPDDE